MFAKTTVSGITSFYALYLNSEGQSATFEYRHEGLEEGFRTVFLTEVNLADGRFHHIAVSVYGRGFALYVDGQLHGGPRMLIASLEDGVGVFFLGRRQGHLSRFSGKYDMHSTHDHQQTAYSYMGGRTRLHDVMQSRSAAFLHGRRLHCAFNAS